MIADVRVVRHRCLWLVASLLILCSGSLTADVAGSSDYAGFQRFPGSEIVDYRTENSTIYPLALGRMQRVTGSVSASESERLQGHLRRITYAIPDGFGAEEVYNHFRSQLLSAGQRELFACQGRGCGSSNYWANDHFNNRILYGPEAGQYYMASTFQSQSNGEEVLGYAALYVVRRGNRRLYAHLDFLELAGAQAEQQRADVLTTAQAMQLRLEDSGVIVIPGISFDDNDVLTEDQGLTLLADVLQRDALLELHLVGHMQEEGDGQGQLQLLQQRSLQRAEAVRQRLVELGVDEDRLEAHGVGPLAPYCRPGPCQQRIEAVVR
ncbi:DUF4892 domain-containing protein [Pseudohongiella sp. SYSU M77423]|uniref:DUF4892 domain-containing protein n=1 Tax=unclassified Pseudohongiella TaxID=2629611 RepID=UPI001F4503DB|nr:MULTISPECIES: DUF4892 domain-containing protein [unclassified Pseudohongiella]MDH7945097.1 DUF4892 domain-containing protein [Pseudohongiella sp. SYSU M77423]